MTVTVSKPQINLREELSSLKKKAGQAGAQVLQAKTGDDLNAATQLYQPALPYWESTSLDSGVGQSNSYSFIDEGNRRFNVQNGNNGTTGMARMHGVLRGQFEIHYECSYQWGWSGIYLIPESNFNPDTNWFKNQNTGIWVGGYNNNSNNQCLAYYVPYNGYTGSTLTTTALAGYSSGLFKFWRGSNNVIYFRPPNGTDYATITTSENCYVIAQRQSPCWVRLNAVISK